jgi:hypothetical protein
MPFLPGNAPLSLLLEMRRVYPTLSCLALPSLMKVIFRNLCGCCERGIEA